MADENDILDDLGLEANNESQLVDPATPPDDKTDSEQETQVEPEKKTEQPEKTEREKELEAELERLRVEKETAEKRARDNQAAYTRAQQELKARKQSGQSEADGGWFGDEDGAGKSKEETDSTVQTEAAAEDEKQKLLQQQLDELKAKQQELEAAEQQRAWTNAEAPVKAQHDDYDHVVYDLLEKTMQKKDDPVAALLLKEFQSKGGTPEAAYELGKRIQQVLEPDAVVQENEQNNNNGSGKKAVQVAARIASGNSSPPSRAPVIRDDDDVIGEVLPR